MPELVWQAEVINLDGYMKIRLKHGQYLEGYFRTVEEMQRHLKSRNVDLADVKIGG